MQEVDPSSLSMVYGNWRYIQWEFVIELCRKQVHIGII